MFALRDNGFDDIACFEALFASGLFGIAIGETILVSRTHAPATMPIGCDEQWRYTANLDSERSGFANACCIYPVSLRKLSCEPIVLGETPRTAFDRQAESFKSSEEFPTGRIHCCRILQRGFCLSQDFLEQLRFLLQKVLNVLCSLALITLLASQAQIQDPG